ncbi:probable tubulin polyglutamylase TTLL2 isoform X1 [Danio rerio]|uniref:Probable tubulin polyglutamylase TTLL2 isoform X1 n=12 Tax=Danio rerio TaxID=7955 RepID=F1QA49_DANRE|nr:probable tubulin polyglutamylase TTLL2 isoform X1 [Danio rerio]|eukprot:XP_017208030.1 probable tubulin polyglutamylase TTLL2 isoform X1 [Danio rerio]
MAEQGYGFPPLVFRLHGGAPQVVREVLLERGWEEFDEEVQQEGDWNLYWRTSGFRNSDYENILPWQRLNHHPKVTHVTRKDYLVRHLRRMKCAFGATLYGFSPSTFILPNEYTKFLGVYTKNHSSRYWICKPVDLSRGRGIFLFEDIKDLVYDSSVIVQRYISNPLLISGYKFDLRIYVCVKSFSPLVIYMHQEGLVRFATEKYTLASLHNLYSHLTNTSINRFGLCYAMDKERVGKGCKWTLSQFRCFLHKQDVNELLLWHKISNIVTLTLLKAVPCIPSSPNCLELLGFDILIDSSYKPWLLEVNHSPALSVDCAADVTVKKGLIGDFIDLLNYRTIDSFRQKGHLRKKYTRSGSKDLQPKVFQGILLSKTLHATPIRKRSWTRPISTSLGSRDIGLCSVNASARNSTVYANRPVSKSKSYDKSTEKVIAVEVESDDLNLRPKNSTRNTPSSVCKLPSLYENKLKSPTFAWDCRTPDRGVPACRVGDFILTFPFNEATWKASREKVDVKVVVNEVQKLTNRLASSFNANERMKTGSSRTGGAVRDKFEALLWGPKDPPLLSECCFSGSELKSKGI